MSLKIDTSVGLAVDIIEAGVVVPFLDGNGEPKHLKGDPTKPMQIRVRSVRSGAGKEMSIRIQRRTAAMNKGSRTASNIPNEEFIALMAGAVTMELINFDADAPLQTATVEEFAYLFRNPAYEALAQQIYEVAGNDATFEVKSKASGNAEAAPAAQTSENSAID